MANNNIKNIFNNASRNISNFFTASMPNDPTGGFDPERNPEMGGGAPNRRSGTTLGQRIKKALGEAAGEVGSGQRLEVYNSYLNTIQHLKNASKGFSLEGTKVSTRPVTSQTGQPERIRTASFENQLQNWNNRFRQFAIRRYYESIGSGK